MHTHRHGHAAVPPPDPTQRTHKADWLAGRLSGQTDCAAYLDGEAIGGDFFPLGSDFEEWKSCLGTARVELAQVQAQIGAMRPSELRRLAAATEGVLAGDLAEGVDDAFLARNRRTMRTWARETTLVLIDMIVANVGAAATDGAVWWAEDPRTGAWENVDGMPRLFYGEQPPNNETARRRPPSHRGVFERG